MSRLVIAVVDDMFFASKIRAVAEAAGIEISFARSPEVFIEMARERQPQLIVVDLHHQKLDAVSLGRDLKSDPELAAIELLGFFSHVETELQRAAQAAGYDRVVPRSAFARDLQVLLAGA
jgi:CheY-like chemotaxis protein